MLTAGTLTDIPVSFLLQKLTTTDLDANMLVVTVEVKNVTFADLLAKQEIKGELVRSSGKLQTFAAPIDEIAIPRGMVRGITFRLGLAQKEIDAFLGLAIDGRRVRGAIRRNHDAVRIFPWAVTPD